MPTKSVYVDASVAGENLKKKLDELKPTPGFCIFIDVVGSTEMKIKSNRTEWIAMMNNGLKFSQDFLQLKPLKFIGDEAMYFIEQADIKQAGLAAKDLFDALCRSASWRESGVPRVKVVAAYCEDVLPITFIEDVQDYFGHDIDRAARLKNAKPEPGEVIIDSCMFEMLTPIDTLSDEGSLTGEKAKGIEGGINYYRWQSERFLRSN